MEEETSMASNAATTLSKETSDLSSGSQPLHCNKRPRHDGSISASRFKGVVGQQNGHWGAQIYANHQRIWLGTFKSESEAAMAYDSAAIKLRSGDSHRNFPWTNVTVQEPNFQSHFSTEAVLNMIKDGSYPSKFADFLRMQFPWGEKDTGLNLVPKHDKGGFLCRQLFQKELTPSDVGKLNRLVIPKKYALRYFPHISEDSKEKPADGEVEDVQLVFYDRLMRSWKFRYCYWKSSQSFVFTRGWNRFVKENELKEKDMVIFSMCECREGSNQIRTFCMIHVAFNDRMDSNASGVEDTDVDAEMQRRELQFHIEQDNVDCADAGGYEEGSLGLQLWQNFGGGEDAKEIEEEKEAKKVESTTRAEKKGLRIFGVQIC